MNWNLTIFYYQFKKNNYSGDRKQILFKECPETLFRKINFTKKEIRGPLSSFMHRKTSKHHVLITELEFLSVG